MLKADSVELQRQQLIHRFRIDRLWIARCVENVLKILQRNFGLAVGVDHVSQFLQRRENVERIKQQREELPDRNFLPENQIEHQKHDARAQRVHRCPLNETQTAQIFHFLKFQLENLVGDSVEPDHLLLGQTKTLHQFDVAQRFG